ncbi:CzcE family metal-binding protein [Pseudoduganella sp. FT25W]|jgi:hypothetical protein|uniref:CzcE family metal-binding protein n=1 Tax=Duganella alba TaxID=2666081 RepID=A0A6L5QQ30_9BURK|nr:CzcE family metal-binding protein [Duganella alba]MRX11797.1 CzcE family metal-binding protein [Duganella alba]MRX19967.1 CzcE family metal-binding protein [Duganella alba]
MFNLLRTALVATALIAGAGAVHAATGQQAPYGSAAAGAYADRQITIDAGTKWVNVNNGETVAFNVNGKSFTWHFETLHNEERFDLARIAPAGVEVGMVTVYVASNPLYRG